jgi:hypothetical protein
VPKLQATPGAELVEEASMGDVAEVAEAGWRPDPTGRYEWRYWDQGWTNRVASSKPSAPAPAGAPLSPSPFRASPAAAPTPAFASAPTPFAVPASAPSSAPSGTTVDFEPLPAPAPRPERDSIDWSTVNFVASSAPVVVAPVEAQEDEPEPRLLQRIRSLLRSFADEPESYHSPHAVELPEEDRAVGGVKSPPSYWRACLVALAAGGVALGASLPWLSGTLSGNSFTQTGFDLSKGWPFTLGALLLAVSGLLGVRYHLMRWASFAVAFGLSAFIVRELIHTHDAMKTLNLSPGTDVHIGLGLLVMTGSAMAALVASSRLGEAPTY